MQTISAPFCAFYIQGIPGPKFYLNIDWSKINDVKDVIKHLSLIDDKYGPPPFEGKFRSGMYIFDVYYDDECAEQVFSEHAGASSEDVLNWIVINGNKR